MRKLILVRIIGKISLALTVIAMLAVGLARAAGGAAVDTYTVIDLGTLPERSRSIAYGISNSVGKVEVVGSAGNISEDERAFIYSDGRIQMLPTLPGGETSQARDINTRGDVVGSSTIHADHGPFHAFLYRGGAIVDLGTLTDDGSSFGNAINENGDVAGSASTADGAIHAVRFSGGRIEDLGTLGGKNSMALGINDKGELVGNAETASGARHAFIHRGGKMEDLGTLGGTESFATRSNINSEVVGYSQDPQEVSRAFLLPASLNQLLGLSALSTLGGTLSQAYGLNDAGQVVGVAQTATGTNHAFLSSTGGALLDLNDLIPVNSGWVLSIAYDISNDGRIVGAGIHNGERRAFLLEPR